MKISRELCKKSLLFAQNRLKCKPFFGMQMTVKYYDLIDPDFDSIANCRIEEEGSRQQEKRRMFLVIVQIKSTILLIFQF